VDGVQSKKNIILAVAKLQLPEAENDLKTYLNVHPDLQKSVLYALGQYIKWFVFREEHHAR
jgi:hypothetical protein